MMSEYYYTTDDKGNVYRYTIKADEDPYNPREENDCHVCQMYIWWNRYNLGDDKKGRSAEDILGELCDKYLPDYDYTYATKNAMVVELQSKASDKVRIYYIYVYEHGGITISMSDGYPYNDRWDGGIGGFIIAEKERFEEVGCNWEDVRENAEAEVDEYDMYLVGDVYGYIEDTYIGDGEWDEYTDSCWGFFSRKWGKELAEEIVETTLLGEDKVDELCEAYDNRKVRQAEYGLYLMGM